MREWIPVSTSPKGRLARRALEDFGSRPFQDVTVGELAAGAGVTTGSLYHHFDSKLGLYSFVRAEAERRLLDRMEGAASARAGDGVSAALLGALIVGFDFAVGHGFVRLLGEAHPTRDLDPVADLLMEISHGGRLPIGRVLAAAWRAALMAVAAGESPPRARAALELLSLDEQALSRGTQPATR
ncbi:MAG: TetR/AcrR family transcriptional regulator [Geodermatophilaceae bacterium]|jgi:AcrR family transcriptional regulator|nr:TetR/AcrR family transcriptional regulator [Geodermatophilaceae bacterium]